MIDFKLRTNDPSDIKRQLQELPDRLEHVRKAMGAEIAFQIRNDVRSKLPGREGWLGIYRDAIEFHHDGKEWAVAAQKNIPDVKDLNAAITLLTFGEGDAASRALAEYNPWPLDLIPALDKSYKTNIKVEAASEGDVSARRTALVRSLPSIKTKLAGLGYAVQETGMPIINGKITADLVFMASRLEYGFAPLPFTPHWRPAVENVGKSIQLGLEDVKKQFAAILKGRMPVMPKPMSAELKSLIATSTRRQVAKLSS